MQNANGYEKPLPDINYLDHKHFWEGTRQGELRIQRCSDCGTWRWFPRPMCPHCHSTRVEWQAVTPEGTLYSWIVVHHPMHPAFKHDVPYTLAIVELVHPPGIRFLGRVKDCDPEDLRIGLPMEAVFDRVTPEVTLVNWRPKHMS